MAFCGPNIWTDGPVIRYRFQISADDAVKMASIAGDMINLLLDGKKPASLDKMIQSGEAVSGASLAAHMFLEGALDLQRKAGGKLPEGRVEESRVAGAWDVFVPFHFEETGRRASLEIFKLMNALDAASDKEALLNRLRSEIQVFRDRFSRFYRSVDYDTPVAEFIEIAEARDIPWKRLNSDKPLIHLGYGRYRKGLEKSIAETESHLSAEAANNKELTCQLLREAGLPVPKQRVVTGERRVIKAAQKMGFPVVIKPLFGMQGYGVTPKVSDDASLAEAVRKASRYHRYTLIEQHIPGRDYRLKIFGGELVAAMERTPAKVVGDGEHKISELARIRNSEPWRLRSNGSLRFGIRKNPETTRKLQSQGLDWETVPKKGEEIYLQDVPNLSQGGEYVLVTDQVHPENARMAVRAAKALGLKIAGVDFITNDISKPYWETGGMICEVNLMPALEVEEGEENPLMQFEHVINQLFPEGATSVIPTIAILSEGNSEIVSWLERIFRFHDLSVGIQKRNEAYVDGSPLSGIETPVSASKALLWNPSVDAALLVLTREDIREFGLGFNQVGQVFLEDVSLTRDEDGEPATKEAVLLCAQARESVISLRKDGTLLIRRNGDRDILSPHKKDREAEPFLIRLDVNDRQPCEIAIELARRAGYPVGKDCLAYLVYGEGISAPESDIPSFLISG